MNVTGYLKDLEEHASSIPEMGGRRVGSHLRKFAREAAKDTAFVELGPWLGAGTAQLALGLIDRSDDHGISIYAYDNFVTSDPSVGKAHRQGVFLESGQDTLPLVKEFLHPFSVDITLVKGMLNHATEVPAEPISIYIDDATKYPHTFMRCLQVFGPQWIPDTTVVILMDYHNWKNPRYSEAKRTQLRCQLEFIEANEGKFREISEFTDGHAAAFVYRGGIDFAKIDVPDRPKRAKK